MNAKYELYEFSLGEFKYYMTSGARSITYNGNLYVQTVIDRGEIEDNEDVEKNSLSLEFPLGNEFAQAQLRSRREQVLYLTLREYENGNAYIMWMGRLDSIVPDDQIIELNFNSSYTTMSAIGARQFFQRTCPYSLYSAGCNLNKDDFAIKTSASSANNLNLTIRGNYPKFYYNLGMIKSSKGDLIGIEKQDGNQFKIMNLYEFEVITNAQLIELDRLELVAIQSRIDFEEAELDYLTLKSIVDNMNPDDPDYDNAVEQMEMAEAVMNQKESEYNDATVEYEEYNQNLPWIWIYPGCNKLNTTCKDKFDNLNNFGGFPFMPQKNPTSRSLI